MGIKYMVKIKICTPYYSEYEEVKKSIVLCREAKLNFDFQAAQGPYIAQARNALVNNQQSQAVRQNVGGKYNHYAFVDSDIGFTPDHITSLIGLNVDVACCPYLIHGSKTVYQCGTFSEPGRVKDRFTTTQRGVKRVPWTGGGFLLVKANVFSKIPYPWFRYGLYEKNGMAEILGEDFCFSMALAEAGISIWCNFEKPVYHRDRLADYAVE